MNRTHFYLNLPFPGRILFLTVICGIWMTIYSDKALAAGLDKVGTQWAPFVEWSLQNPSYSGNPYDLIATATFTHSNSGEKHTTGMFYDGGNTWKFRFAGTRTGKWTFATASKDADLAGKSGTVTINPNTNSKVKGFVTTHGNKWARQVDGNGNVKAFVPQYVMVVGPQGYYKNPSKVQADISTFIDKHGFNGFHLVVACRWFHMDEMACPDKPISTLDHRTFEGLELLITKLNEAGAVLHFWVWGDLNEQNFLGRPNMTIAKWGRNGEEDRRLQRYIAARLGPIPGWTMSYGFDLFEWVNTNDLKTWHNYMNQNLGWPHLLGGRASTNKLDQIYEGLDYSSYETHKPDYDMYVKTMNARPKKPSFSEDRFRIRTRYAKDYTMELTRQGLWHSAMAGGVANIWGNMLPASKYDDAGRSIVTSAPYPNPEWIKTNSLFFKDRFVEDLVRCNSLTDGVCLKRPNEKFYIFYKEGTSSISMNLSKMVGSREAIAVDTKKPFKEIAIGTLSPKNQNWTAPYRSDWAIAVDQAVAGGIDSVPPKKPTGIQVD